MKCLGSEADCVIELVEQYWPSHGTISMAHLAEALVPILKKLLEPSAEVTDRDRGICEAIVATWLCEAVAWPPGIRGRRRGRMAAISVLIEPSRTPASVVGASEPQTRAKGEYPR